VQLRGHLHARRPAAADDERQQPLALLGQGLRQRGALEALGDVAAQPGRVLDRLEEEGVLLMRLFLVLFVLVAGEGERKGKERERRAWAEKPKKKGRRRRKNKNKNQKTNAPRRP